MLKIVAAKAAGPAWPDGSDRRRVARLELKVNEMGLNEIS